MLDERPSLAPPGALWTWRRGEAVLAPAMAGSGLMALLLFHIILIEHAINANSKCFVIERELSHRRHLPCRMMQRNIPEPEPRAVPPGLVFRMILAGTSAFRNHARRG
jgi:hypothetical protein